jgi:LPXTG-motif cell wall-anchored protein
MRIRRIAPVAALAVSGLALSCFVAAGPAVAADGAFTRTATYPVYLNVPEGVDPAAETVAEISTITPDGSTMIYTDALGQRIGFIDVTDPSSPQGTGTVSLAELGHADDQPTSVAAIGDYVLVVIDETGGDFEHPKGRVDVLRISDRERVASIDLEGQPDSIDISDDGQYAAIAIENQRDEEREDVDGGLPQLPAGFVSVIDLAGDPTTWQSERIDLVDESGAPIEVIANAGLDTPEDPEPEYVSINSDNVAAVTLQENNGVAIIDLETRTVTDAWSAGTVSVDQLDTEEDGVIDLSGSITDTPREPDAVGWVNNTTLATANEGDWKGGTRGWTVFGIDGTVQWDAGNSFEHLAIQHGLYNDGRAGKKGPEPEGLAIAEYNGTNYAFIASERSNFVAVYNVDDPANPVYEQLLFTTNGPEGVLPVPSRDLLLISSEVDEASAGVRSSVNIFEFGDSTPAQPSIVSGDDENGLPIGWSALGALTADPSDANLLYSATDAALKNNRIYTIDVSAEPALITEARDVTKDGVVTSYDIEGIAAKADGGFWLASEGATGAENLLVELDADLNVVQEISLPEDVSAHIGKWGLEGVTVTEDADGNEVLYFAVQRPLWVDPAASPLEPLEGANTTRIGQFSTATGEFAWFGYELESTDVAGDWMGLSEITVVDDNTLAVIERDKLNGPNAAIKRIYTVEVPDAQAIADADGAVIPVEKNLAIDVLPELQAVNGWTQEKLEGFTIAADGQLYAVTDNDGLDDATGETVFLRLGSADDAFGTDPEPTQSPEPTETTQPTSTAVPTTTASASSTDGASEPAASPSDTDTDADGNLATTGADAGTIALIGLLAAGAIAAGAALVLRRRKQA